MKITIDESGVTCSSWLSRRCYRWDSLSKVLLTVDGRRVIVDREGIRRVPNYCAYLSLKGRMRRVRLVSSDATFIDDVREVVIEAQRRDAKIEIGVAGTLLEWSEMLGVDLE